MDNRSRIYPCVSLGENVHIDDFCILGLGCDTTPLSLGKNAIIRSHTIIYSGTSIGVNFATGHTVLIRNGCTIGDDVSIGSSTVIEHSVHIGNNVRIHSQAFIPEFSVIHDNAWIGPGVRFTNAKYPKSPNVKEQLLGPLIHEHAIICAGAILLPGVRIGKHALVGAGSVVVTDVDEGCVVAGNPARVIKEKQDIIEYSYHEKNTSSRSSSTV